MPEVEADKRRKTTRRKKRESARLGPDTKNNNNELSPPESSEPPPATLEDLRKARLTYLATPPAERQKKMKYEYSKTVKVKERVREESKDGSIVSKTRTNRPVERRKTRTRSEKTRTIDEEVEDDQYVYGPSRAKKQMPGAFASSESASDGKRVKNSRSTRAKVERPKPERRNTEPPARSRSVKFEEPTRSSQPVLSKNKSNVQTRPRSVTNRSSIPEIPGSIHATLEPETASIAPLVNTRRSSSIFGGLFGSKPQLTVKRKVSCLTCGDDVPTLRTAKLPCTHRMCHSCLERLFKLAVSDPAHMPPRCCEDQAISLKHVNDLFDQEFKEIYNMKLKEYKAKDRIYCPARGCGEWIQPKYITLDKGRKIGRCQSCKTQVCGTCSQKMHKTRDCPKDPATKEFVETAKKAGWKKCYNCNAMVELKEGCNHMTCRCTAEFCMVCGLKWKSCDCPWFSYDRIDVNGDPVQYQQELDRRREQELRDEAMARRMEVLQMNGDRPTLAEWINLDNGATQTNIAGGLWGAWQTWGFGTRQLTPPAMPGSWDDGPQQYQEISPRPRRYHRRERDPAAMPEAEATEPNVLEVPVVRHRGRTRTETAPAGSGFEGRVLTAAEREQERQIRAWAQN